MKTYNILVHFYEQDETDDQMVVIITQQDYEDDYIQKKIETIKFWHVGRHDDFDCREDMIDSMFNQLAEEIDCVWCYNKSYTTLVIGDPREEAETTGNLKAVNIGTLARMLSRLNPGANLYFYEEYDEEEGYSGNIFCATLIKKYESYAIYINCRGGGLPFISDITEYYQDLSKQKAELTEYLGNIENFGGSVYVDSGLVTEDIIEE